MKQKLLKSLLAIAMLCVGVGNVWAATSYLTTWTGQVGTNDNAGEFYYATKKVKIAAGETYVYTLTNYNNENNDEPWKNWVVEGNLEDSKYFDCEARGHKWQAGGANVPVYTPVIETSDVSNWQTAYNGATVTITISRNADGDKFTITHTSNVLGTTEGNTGKYYGGTFTVSVGAAEEWDIYITEEYSHFLVTKVAYSHSEGGAIYTMPKMTYVNYNDADHSYGEIAYGETARSGYNIISAGSVGFNTPGWNVNYITYVNADASDVPGGSTITAASLAFAQSGSTDNKRTTGVGAGYNSSTWSSTMTYNTADKSITTVGDVVWTTTKSESTFESKSINITAAFSDDADNIVNILLYETAAAGCYIKNPELSITYTTAATYDVTFTETNSVAATIKIDDTDVTAGTSLVNGDYSFTATAAGYEAYNGNFTVSGADLNVEFTMTAKTPVTSITVNYTYNDEVVFSEVQSSIAGLYVGDSYEVPFRMYVMNGGILYKSTKRGSNPWYGEPTTLIANTVVEKAVTPVDLGGGTVVLFEDLDNTAEQNAGVRASYCSAYDNRAYTSAENLPAGVYDFIVYAQNKGRGSSVKIGETTVFTITDVVSSTGSWTEKNISNVTVPTAGQLTFVVGGNSTYDDYDIIIAVLKSVNGTIPSSGFGSLASAYGLDFSSATVSEGELTAYVVSEITKEKAKLTTVTEMPANSGVILEGTAGATYSIPVKADATFAGTNKLQAAVTATDIEANQAYILQSGEFHLVTAASTIPAGKAYLLAEDVPDEVKALTFVFDETAIRSIEGETMKYGEKAEIYNLAGQRVLKAQRGIYIVNGKKVVIK